MSQLLFIDESGQDHRESPYEVLAGVAVEDDRLWNLIQALHAEEERQFGRRYSRGTNELKAKKILKRKVFRQAKRLPALDLEVRCEAAKRCLESGDSASQMEITALAQSKIEFARRALELMQNFDCTVFAVMVDRDAKPTERDFLRKDYAFLFERFFYFLEDECHGQTGIAVFDELERSRSHILVEQMNRYFRRTAKGRSRSARILPEPFFVHSDLTTGVQLADLAAYVLSWAYRFGAMPEPERPELVPFASSLAAMRHRAVRQIEGNSRFQIWSICQIDDLRCRDEKDMEC